MISFYTFSIMIFWIKKLCNIVIQISYIITLCIAVFYLVLFFLPTSLRFEYEGIEPSQAIFSSDVPMSFISTLQAKRDVKLEYSDILMCRYESNSEVETYVTNYQTENVHKQDAGMYRKPWEWRGHLPTRSGTCYLRSIVCTNVLGIDKCQYYNGKNNGNEFIYIHN